MFHHPLEPRFRSLEERCEKLEEKHDKLEDRINRLEPKQDELGKRVGELEKQHEKHDKLLFGWTDEQGDWHDGIFQTVTDIRHFSARVFELLSKAIPWVVGSTVTTTVGVLAYLARAAYRDWIDHAQSAVHLIHHYH